MLDIAHDHELKVLTPYFGPLADGSKKFEVRRDDRGFQRGDVLWLREFIPDARSPRQQWTGNAVFAQIDWILTGGQMGIEAGFVVMSITILSDNY